MGCGGGRGEVVEPEDAAGAVVPPGLRSRAKRFRKKEGVRRSNARSLTWVLCSGGGFFFCIFGVSECFFFSLSAE